MAMVLYTERLSLQEMTLGDADEVTRILKDPHIYANTLQIPYPYTREDALAWLGEIEKNRAEGKSGWTFGIREKESTRLLGVIGLTPVNRHDETEAGYWMDGEARGKGYATEALQALIKFAFELGCHKVSARHFTGNRASGRVMEKAGMEYEGILREALKKEGLYYDDVCYGILNPNHKDLRAPQQGMTEHRQGV